MSLKQWENKVLEAPGADERVREIEDELRLAAGLTALREQAGVSQRELAERIGVADGDLVTVTSRRGTITLPAHVVATIRPDTVFIPYHWPGDKAANQLTNRALDPLSRMPEFKVSVVDVVKAAGRRDTADTRDLDLHDGSA